MRLRGVPVGSLQPLDIQALVENRVDEGRFLDYKEATPGGSNEAKKDFLADVTAMANTAGGVLLYGVCTVRDESGRDTGIPETVTGVQGVNFDQEVLRLQSMVHDGVSPSLAGQVRLQRVDLPGAAGPVIALGVPRSILAPHRIIFNKLNRFYRRSEAGNYESDVPELRRMFLEASTWLEQVENWRDERVRRVRAQQVYPRIITTRVVFVHVVPLGRLDQALELRSRTNAFIEHLRPLGDGGFNWRYNADGFLLHREDQNQTIASHTQVFRFGGVEGFSSQYLGTTTPPGGGGSSLMLWANEFDREVTEYVEKALAVIREVCGPEPPYAVLVGLYGVRGARIPRARWDASHEHGNRAGRPSAPSSYR